MMQKIITKKIVERASAPTPDIIKRQKIASNPNASVWVEANAGSGKTHVLVERVLRLLLSGVLPQNLLCLTYTKAAASEMSLRVSKKLGEWTLMNDEILKKQLTDLTLKIPSETDLKNAKKLFALTLETPGGLKINTIHAFCESVLHRFVIEANVPLNFSSLDEIKKRQMIEESREKIFAFNLLDKGDVAKSANWLFNNLGDVQINAAIDFAINQTSFLSEVLKDIKGAKARLKKLVKYDENDTIENLDKEILNSSLFPPKDYIDVFAVCAPNETQNRFEDKLAKIDVKNPNIDLILKAFLNADFSVPKSFPKADYKKALGGLGEKLLAEAQRLETICKKKKTALLVIRSCAFIDVLGAVFSDYSKQKTALSLLDFDDLIKKTSDLFNSKNMAWVLYKLDANISHILVDESQDTNEEQWKIVKKLCEEFFVGSSSKEENRTIFAVGDKKQSIFSFQGAKPILFSETGMEIKLKAKNVKKDFYNVELKASFRTLPNILNAVDLICQQKEIANALLSENQNIIHESARVDKGGKIILWEPIKQSEIELPKNRWPLEKDNLKLINAPKMLAERIVNNIENWLKNKRPLAQRGRAIKESDILILVQKRNVLFHEIIRALKKKNIKTPGSDKLLLSSHIVVLDLLALADILLNPNDDLNLAAILRSPLFEVSEDELFKIAHNRNKTSLWQSLKNSPILSAKKAFKDLNQWRNRLDFDRPYELFAQILYAKGGLKKYHTRLGSEVDDVIFEFLDFALAHENDRQPSLQGFLDFMRQSEIFIKRNLSEKDAGVRIMTVHGAKGLEAPIVILADAVSTPDIRKSNKLINFINQPNGVSLVHSSKKEDYCENSIFLYEENINSEKQEYWRKLYVAMTRAEDELYVTGALSKTGKIENSWYGAIKNALKGDCIISEMQGEDISPEIITFPKNLEKIIPLKIKEEEIKKPFFPVKIKEYITPKATEIIRPSLAYDKSEEIFEINISLKIDADLARKKGISLHVLLEHLPKIEKNKQKDIAKRALEILLPNEKPLYDEIINQALDILNSEKTSFLFGKNSRAEMPFLFDAKKNNNQIKIAGRFDRIIIEENKVLLIDFKSDNNPPTLEQDINEQYLTQMGLYYLAGEKLFPDKKIEIAIFWTSNQNFMPISKNEIKKHIANYTLL